MRLLCQIRMLKLVRKKWGEDRVELRKPHGFPFWDSVFPSVQRGELGDRPSLDP